MKFFLLLVAFMFLANLASANQLQIVTEEFPPFNYTENGKITGFSTEVIEAILKETSIQGEINSYPWARAYMKALKEQNVAIYSLVRTAERENLFHWVGPINLSRGYIYKLKSNTGIHINKIEDAASYKLGLVREFAITQRLLANPNFVKNKNVILVSREEQLIKMLKLGRIEIMVMAEPTLIHRTEHLGESNGMIEKVFLMGETQGYLGVNKHTSRKTVIQMQKALGKLKKNGTYNNIFRKYFPKTSTD